MKVLKYTALIIPFLLFSCGESKEELREQIEERDRIIKSQRDQIADLQERLDNVKNSISSFENAIQDARMYGNRYGDIDDAEDEVNNIDEETDYED